jgi:Polyketide cyclase / dehydrase and lipid transport
MTTMRDDLIERSIHIHWPEGFDPLQADLFAHNALVVNAPVEHVWATLVAAQTWPNWYSNSNDVVVNDPSGQLDENVTFSWSTFGFNLVSQVAEFVPRSRLGWYGNGEGLRAYHTWMLISRSAKSTYVVMEEVAFGQGPQKLARSNPGHMHRGHDLWNISLKFACET